MLRHAITTKDNPFDPFDQFRHWYEFDEAKGYHSCSLLARFIAKSNNIGMIQSEKDTEAAIDAIIDWFPETYKKVSREIPCEADALLK